MASRNVPLPYFPMPPRTYDPRFFYEFLRAFSVYMTAMQNPGEGRNTFIVLTALQDNDYGLEPGAVFQVDGALRIALEDMAYTVGLGAAGAVGSVTVTT